MSLEPLIDSHKRKINSLRFSIIDRCNLRCTYCMPEEGIDWLKKDDILTYEEIIYLTGIFYDMGIKNFRLTGGEPTLRKDIVKLTEMIANEYSDINLSMTTNGLKLSELAEPLKNAGLNNINISLDTFDHQKFSTITRRNSLDNVVNGIKKAKEVGFDKIKINAVSIKDFNSDYQSIKKFIDFSEEFNIEVRFIEFMPFTGMNWNDGGFIPSLELREIIAKHEKLEQLKLLNGSQTSRNWKLRNGKANIGFISSVSESFCKSCDRIRITSEGNLRPCLHSPKEYPLRNAIRNNVSREEIINQIRQALNDKWKEHPDFLSLQYLPPIDDREMIRIGG